MKGYTQQEYGELLQNYPEINENFDYNDFSEVKTLYRGCHIEELDPDLDLKDIQGKPEDDSYSGNVLHMTDSYIRAWIYSQGHTLMNFGDNRTCIIAYDVEKLTGGEFTPDKVDGLGTITSLESLNACRQLRWEHYGENGQQTRLNAIKFIMYQDLPYLNVSDIRERDRDEEIKGDFIVEYKETRILAKIDGNRIEIHKQFSAVELDIIYDRDTHEYLVVGKYIYKPRDKIIVYSCLVEECDNCIHKLSANYLGYIPFFEKDFIYVTLDRVYPIRL